MVLEEDVYINVNLYFEVFADCLLSAKVFVKPLIVFRCLTCLQKLAIYTSHQSVNITSDFFPILSWDSVTVRAFVSILVYFYKYLIVIEQYQYIFREYYNL